MASLLEYFFKSQYLLIDFADMRILVNVVRIIRLLQAELALKRPLHKFGKIHTGGQVRILLDHRLNLLELCLRPIIFEVVDHAREAVDLCVVRALRRLRCLAISPTWIPFGGSTWTCLPPCPLAREAATAPISTLAVVVAGFILGRGARGYLASLPRLRLRRTLPARLSWTDYLWILELLRVVSFNSATLLLLEPTLCASQAQVDVEVPPAGGCGPRLAKLQPRCPSFAPSILLEVCWPLRSLLLPGCPIRDIHLLAARWPCYAVCA